MLVKLKNGEQETAPHAIGVVFENRKAASLLVSRGRERGFGIRRHCSSDFAGKRFIGRQNANGHVWTQTGRTNSHCQ